MLRARPGKDGPTPAYNLQLLAEAGKILSSSLDYNVTLSSIANLITSTIADLCYIDLLQDDGSLHRVVVVDSNKRMQQIAHVQYKYPPSKNAKEGAYSVVRTGIPLLISPVTDAWLQSVSNDEDDFKSMKALGYRSMIFVALFARGKTIGVLSVASRNDRLYGAEDIKLAEEIASRAALAVDNARLFYQAQEAIRARDEFLSIASHELKTPLTSILLQLQITMRNLRKGEKGSTEQLLQMLESTERQGKKLHKLINDLLNISLITTGRLHLEIEHIDFSHLVEDIIERLKPQLDKEGYTLHADITPGIQADMDRVRIEQVISNFLTNAIKYGNKKPVEVTVKKKNDMVVFSIKDQGIGIKPEYQKEIFERFARGVSTRDYRGLGVGLYISRQIVETHGGSISLESEIGKGSTFTIHLPLKQKSTD